MANKFAIIGGGCSCFSWVLMILACGLPLFSSLTIEYEKPDGSVLYGYGIWGQGVWYSGGKCDMQEAKDEACYDYNVWEDEQLEFLDLNVAGAQATSILGVMTGLVTVVLGFVGRWKLAVISASVTAVFALVPFALWEDDFCPIIGTVLAGIPGITGEEECGRSWSYGFQIVAWLGYVFSIVMFVLGNKSD